VSSSPPPYLPQLDDVVELLHGLGTMLMVIDVKLATIVGAIGGDDDEAEP
jgi:hypothetical protein